MARDISYPNSATCFALRAGRIYRFFTGLYDNALAGHGVSATQLNILMAAREHSNVLTGTDLIQKLHLDRSTVSKQLHNLQRRELVTLHEHIDRRYKAVQLTEAGQRLLHGSVGPWRIVQQQLVDIF